MKKIISLLLSIIILTCSLPLVCASASTSADGLYEFEVIDNSYAEITNYLGSSEYLEIPAEISTNRYTSYPVKRIGSNFFDDMYADYFGGGVSTTTVIIPEGVTSIGEAAFRNCTVNNLILPSTITNIEADAFYSSRTSYGLFFKIKNLYYNGDINSWCNIDFENTYSNPLCYGTANFYINNELVENIEIPSSITEIKDYSFTGMLMKGVTLSSSVKTIGEAAFRFCDLMTSVTMSNGVKHIGARAFSGCESLTAIVLPESIESIGYQAFSYCSNLELAILPKDFGLEGGLFYGDEKVSIHSYVSSRAYSYAVEEGIPFFAHEFTEIVDYKEPTCTEAGGNVIKCSHCNEIILDTPALGHDFDKGHVIKETTCSIEGILEQTCLRCGFKQKSAIPTKAHKWKYVIKRKATCFKAGLGGFKCTVCKTFSDKTKSIPKIKLKKPKAKFVKVGNKLKMKYNKVEGATGFEIVFVVGTSIYREKVYLITSKKNKTCFKKILTNMKNCYCYGEVRAYAKQGNKIKWSKPTKLKKIYL